MAILLAVAVELDITPILARYTVPVTVQPTGPVRGPDLLVEIDPQSELPLHEQLERSLREGIRSGRLRSGMRLPSTRTLATELGISRGVITEAYSQLGAEGYLETRQGAATKIASAVRASAPHSPARSLLPSFTYHFHPGVPDLAGFPRAAWLRSLRAAWRESPLDSIGYGDPRGVPQLREALADYLGRVRGAATEPENMLMCTGFMQGFSLLCRLLHSHGIESIALEDPGWHVHRLIAEQAGLRTVPVPVDADGICIDALTATDVAAVLVTPAHQFPTGCVLSRERRVALIEWAENSERLIIEDDFDAEYRYDRVAVGALQGLAPERVVYIGSASKRLAPGMRLGWMLVPSWLTWDLVTMKAIEDGGSEVIGQLALCDFIARGELDRHTRRMRLRYQQRREALLGALAHWFPTARPGSSAAGLYELVELPEDVSESELLSCSAARGVGMEGLAWHRFSPGGTPGVLLGFGNLSEPAIEQGVRLISEALAEVQAR
jgi:GntR family transcriptional regulator/MocR family aminotransferase